jgi:hypothetical protein
MFIRLEMMILLAELKSEGVSSMSLVNTRETDKLKRIKLYCDVPEHGKWTLVA